MVKTRIIFFIALLFSLMLQGVATEAGPIRAVPDIQEDSDEVSGLEDSGLPDTSFRMMDQLGLIDIDEEYFYDLSLEHHGELDMKAPGYGLDLYGMGGGGIRRSILGFDRGTAFDRRKEFDRGLEFDAGAKFDKGANFDKSAGFDSLRGFDREGLLRIRAQRERERLPSRPEEQFSFDEAGEETALLKPTRGEEEVGSKTGGEKDQLLSPEKEVSKKDLLREDELGLGAVHPVERGFFIKLAMFVIALLALLAGTLKGLIPFKFYFFLTILILILWNPMENLFISIIIGLSALLGPIFG